MSLKRLIDSLEEVDEAVRSLYTERSDGKFELDVDGDDDSGLKKALEAERRSRREIEKKMKALNDVDPEKYRELLEKESEREEEEAQRKGEWDTLRDQLLEKHKKEADKLNGRIATLSGHVERREIDAQLSSGLGSVKVMEPLREAALALLRSKYKAEVVEEDGEFRGVIKAPEGDKNVPDFVKEWAETDEAKPFLAPSDQSGTGRKPDGGTGGTPAPKGSIRYEDLGKGDNAAKVASGELTVVE